MRVMDARARVSLLRKRTRVFTLRVTESIRKIAGQRVAERARWLTLTRIPGSVWPIVSLL